MLLLAERQARMRELAAGLTDGTTTRKQATTDIRELLKMEQKSAEGTQATIDRSEHDHVRRSGQAALKNREQTTQYLNEAVQALKERDTERACVALINAANCGGKKSVKAMRQAPTVSMYVQYLAETDTAFQEWLKARGVKA